jgi:chromosome segregation protein
MHINRLRLIGFKSFVEPAELRIEKGLTGVVGPNGCGKSNLLEALRWVMGETSYKSMRAGAMEDVIFAGTNTRPARNSAEVTIYIDNSGRKAPAEFNGSDTLEVTRRIERDAGSAYRINGKEVRARDVRILFEDAATGARSPALVRQGQIGELVDAKPEERRRILEDAAGIAGLHSRRHEAELRLAAAENNLARLNDLLGQLQSQMDSLKRQARAARRYKEISAEIRSAEAVLCYLSWAEAQAELEAEEAHLAVALEQVARATQAEAEALRCEAEAAELLQPLRQAEAAAGAVVQRLKIEHDNLEREAKHAADRQRELEARIEQFRSDIAREETLAAEARDTLARLEAETSSLQNTERLAAEYEQRALATYETAEAALRDSEARLEQLTAAATEARARRLSLEAQIAESKDQIAKLERQLLALEAQTREIIGRAPEASKLKAAAELGQKLMADIALIEAQASAAEEQVQAAAADAVAKSEAARTIALAAGQLRTEVETLNKLLKPATQAAFPPILKDVKVARGYEAALWAALGDDLDASADESAPAHWRLNAAGEPDPPLPEGASPLSAHVMAPVQLVRRLQQVGVVRRADAARLQRLLKPGQRLVSREGDLWRWDGFVAAAASPTAAASRIQERSRLAALADREIEARRAAEAAQRASREAGERHRAAEAEERRLRQLWRETQTKLAQTRETLTGMERQARETETKLAAVAEVKKRLDESLSEAKAKYAGLEQALRALDSIAALESELASAQREAAARRASLSEARTELIALEREHRARTERLQAIAIERERCQARTTGALKQIATVNGRLAEAQAELSRLASLPARVEAQRQNLMSEMAAAEKERRAAADRLAAAETAHRQAAQQLRSAQATLAGERETRARIEARLEGARTRRGEEARKIRDQLGCAPDECLALAGVAPGAQLPPLQELDRQLVRLKADRERLGAVNLQADEELQRVSEQYEGLRQELVDVEAAIAKLRAAIAQINKEGRSRLQAAFDTVDGHFRRLFTTLFGGGEARLAMIDAEDPLQGGLEVVAKPPGKKPVTLSLLSGGEQALTALSLIFAVFLTNPAPICVLDEVDAPLDDANVDRFCSLLEKMAAETDTRFLVITHHPMTMARMNRLYGVTMAEKGVSQLVSVDLETAHRFTAAA